MKAYVATPSLSSFRFNIAKKLEKEFHDLDFYIPENLDERNKELLSSQILIVNLDELDFSIAEDVGVFVGSLETLRLLRLRHSPKFIIGVNLEDNNSNCIYNTINTWGVVVHTIEDLIYLLKDFIDNYPI